MLNTQAKEIKQAKQASPRRTTTVAGWLVLYSLLLVGINVAKQRQLQNSRNLVHRMAPAQPQELPKQHNGIKRDRRLHDPHIVRPPTLNTEIARTMVTLMSKFPQGRQQKAQTFVSEKKGN